MTLQIHAFGIARDILGARVVAFETPAALTVSELKRQLLERYPAFGDLTSLLIAVNAEYGAEDVFLTGLDEIALIPPVSGG
jgi:molybdopterin converting factor small subunit